MAAAGVGRGRMDGIIAAAVADVHALGMSTNTPQGQRALVAAIKRHLEDTKGTLDGAGADASTRAAGANTTAAGYNGTAPAMSPAGMPPAAQMLGSAVPAVAGMAGMPMSMLSGLPSMGGGLLSPFASLTSMAQPGGLSPAGMGDAPSALLGGDNTVAAGAVRRALAQLGKPYVWGGVIAWAHRRRLRLFGLVQYAYGGVGVDLPRTTYAWCNVGRPVPPGQVQPGDLVLSNFSSPGVPEHVQLAIGGGKVVEAPNPGWACSDQFDARQRDRQEGRLMPLNYASLEQVSGWRFLSHRVSVAIGRRNVRLIHDPSKNAGASLMVGVVIAVLGIGLGFILAFFKPMGQAGNAADRGRPGQRRHLRGRGRHHASGVESGVGAADHRPAGNPETGADG